MSLRRIQSNTVDAKTLVNPPRRASQPSTWTRNPTWPALPTVTSTDQKFVGLYAVYPDSAYIAVQFATSGGANYTVDWGDGTTLSYASNTNASYQYDFNDVDLANTNGPVTFTASTSTVNRTNHGYTNGMTISFNSIVTTTGITAGAIYYIINATTDTFQLSLTSGGSAITLTNDGTGIILPYKLAIVTVTPVAGNFSSMTLNLRHSSITTVYNTNWLDIAFAGAFTGININQTTTQVTANSLEQINMVKTSLTSYASLFPFMTQLQSVLIPNDSAGTVTNASSMFQGCTNLQTAPFFNSSSVSNWQLMFQGCTRLTNVPSYDMSGGGTAASMFAQCTALTTLSLLNTQNITSTNAMFQDCRNLVEGPVLNTQNVTDMGNMFQGCVALTSVPLYNTIKVTTMFQTFINCFKLQSIPLFNTSNVANMLSTFNACSSLTTIPLIDTSNVTVTQSMFSGCFNLTEIPPLNTQKVTGMTNMFLNCAQLVSIPLLNTINVTNMTSTFNGCSGLQSIPELNTSNVQVWTSTFSGCSTITTIPLLNTARGTGFNSTFAGCTSLQTIPTINTINATSFNSTFSSCTSLVNVPLLNTSNVTDFSSTFLSCTSLISVPTFNTNKVVTTVSMFGGCTALRTIPAFNLANCTTIFGGTLSSLSELNAFNMRTGVPIAAAKLSRTGLQNVFANLGSNVAGAPAVTITNNPGADTPISRTATSWAINQKTILMNGAGNVANIVAGMQVTGNNFSNAIGTTAFANSKIGLACNMDDNVMVRFTTVSTSNLVANTYYYVRDRIDNNPTFYYSLSTTPGGSAISFTAGSMNTTPNILVTSVAGTQVDLNASPSSTTGGALTFRLLNTNMATFKGFVVTG